MSALRRISAALVGLLLTVGAFLAGAPAAFAAPVPPDPAVIPVPVPQPPAAPATIVSHGSPIWMFLVVAAVAIILTAAVTVAALRLRHSLRPQHGHA